MRERLKHRRISASCKQSCESSYELLVRRDRDSNPGPWHCCRAAVFKTTSIGHSDTPPCVGIVEGLRF